MKAAVICVRAILCAALMYAVPHYAWAVSVDSCPQEVMELEAAFPEGITDTWLEIIGDELNLINAEGDFDTLSLRHEQVFAEYEAYLVDPDPDGDGYAFSPEAMSGKTFLFSCLYLARMDELLAESGDSDSATEPEEEVAAESLASPPIPTVNAGEWFSGDAYPASAIREGRGGVVEFDITVGTDGAPLGCQASGGPGNADLEVATCEVIWANAKFYPAQDDNGNPVVGEYANHIRWEIP